MCECVGLCVCVLVTSIGQPTNQPASHYCIEDTFTNGDVVVATKYDNDGELLNREEEEEKEEWRRVGERHFHDLIDEEMNPL